MKCIDCKNPMKTVREITGVDNNGNTEQIMIFKCPKCGQFDNKK